LTSFFLSTQEEDIIAFLVYSSHSKATSYQFNQSINAYRLGAAEVPIKEVQEPLGDSNNRLNVYLG